MPPPSRWDETLANLSNEYVLRGLQRGVMRARAEEILEKTGRRNKRHCPLSAPEISAYRRSFQGRTGDGGRATGVKGHPQQQKSLLPSPYTRHPSSPGLRFKTTSRR